MIATSEKLEIKKTVAAWKRLCLRNMCENFDTELFIGTVVDSYNILKKHKDDKRPPLGTWRIFRLIKKFCKPVSEKGSDYFFAARTIAEDLYLSFGSCDMIGSYEGGVTHEGIEAALEGLVDL